MNVDDLKTRLRKASAYLSDHHGLLLEDDQTDLLCADSAEAADRIEKLEAAAKGARVALVSSIEDGYDSFYQLTRAAIATIDAALAAGTSVPTDPLAAGGKNGG